MQRIRERALADWKDEKLVGAPVPIWQTSRVTRFLKLKGQGHQPGMFMGFRQSLLPPLA